MDTKVTWTPQSMGRKGAQVLREKYGPDYFKKLSDQGRKALPKEHFSKMSKRRWEKKRKAQNTEKQE